MKKEAHLEAKQLSAFPTSLLLELFPFGILINPDMIIMGVGEKLVEISKGRSTILGKPVTKFFSLRRPKGIPFTWKNVSVNLFLGFVHGKSTMKLVYYMHWKSF